MPAHHRVLMPLPGSTTRPSDPASFGSLRSLRVPYPAHAPASGFDLPASLRYAEPKDSTGRAAWAPAYRGTSSLAYHKASTAREVSRYIEEKAS